MQGFFHINIYYHSHTTFYHWNPSLLTIFIPLVVDIPYLINLYQVYYCLLAQK